MPAFPSASTCAPLCLLVAARGDGGQRKRRRWWVLVVEEQEGSGVENVGVLSPVAAQPTHKRISPRAQAIGRSHLLLLRTKDVGEPERESIREPGHGNARRRRGAPRPARHKAAGASNGSSGKGSTTGHTSKHEAGARPGRGHFCLLANTMKGAESALCLAHSLQF